MSTYIERGKFLFKWYRIEEKLEKIESSWETLSQQQRSDRLNKLDYQATNLLLSAKKGYRKLRTGAIDYSPTLSNLELW